LNKNEKGKKLFWKEIEKEDKNGILLRRNRDRLQLKLRRPIDSGKTRIKKKRRRR